MNKIYRWQQKKQMPQRQRLRDPSETSISGAESSVSLSDNESYRDFSLRSGNQRKKFPDMFNRSQRGRRGKDHFKVVNLSEHTLSATQLDVLKGLTVSPSSNIDPFTAVKDVHLFSRKLILRKLHFKAQSNDGFNTKEEIDALEILRSLEEENTGKQVSTIPNHLFDKSKKFPSLGLCPAIDVFTKLVTNDIQSLTRIKMGRSNLTKMEKLALDELKSWDDVVYKAADKGGNLVIWPTSMYEKQANVLPGDSNCYRKLTFNPLSSFQAKLVNILEDAFSQGIISKKLLDNTRNFHPKMATFYFIPKLHKNSLDPPGRPIVAGNSGLCEVISDIVDFFLKPLVAELPSFVRDTTSALQWIDQLQLDENMILVTADVESLYTSIKHCDGLAATRIFLSSSNIDPPIPELVLLLLEFLLNHNVFTFNGDIFLQLQGTAMGASCAPAYANLFLGAWERSIFQDDHIQDVDYVHNWMRYIDDILFIWEGTYDGLCTLFDRLNRNDINVKLTFKSGRSLEFLDIWIETAPDGRSKTDIY
ncbi:receptor activity-modifying protein 1 isoform X1 [Dendrobates tinctorius]|uniref:receptor activity-modifying protein 1 isoform X1 n=1 Tax=Dendrobates tinctorius TaxID=92724 RepID=UPI003CC9A5AE